MVYLAVLWFLSDLFEITYFWNSGIMTNILKEHGIDSPLMLLVFSEFKELFFVICSTFIKLPFLEPSLWLALFRCAFSRFSFGCHFGKSSDVAHFFSPSSFIHWVMFPCLCSCRTDFPQNPSLTGSRQSKDISKWKISPHLLNLRSACAGSCHASQNTNVWTYSRKGWHSEADICLSPQLGEIELPAYDSGVRGRRCFINKESGCQCLVAGRYDET